MRPVPWAVVAVAEGLALVALAVTLWRTREIEPGWRDVAGALFGVQLILVVPVVLGWALLGWPGSAIAGLGMAVAVRRQRPDF